MAMSRSIAVVTSSRADFSHLYWPLVELQARENISLELYVTGAHLSNEFGRAVDEIEAAGFPVAERVECLVDSDTDTAMARTIGLGTISFADVLGRRRPDLLLLIADRYEMLAPASAALALRIPMVHIEGGEASFGAIDHAVRNALTMMSHVHLVPTELAAERVRLMGEESWRVHRTGAPSLDHIRRGSIAARGEVEAAIGCPLEPAPLVVAHHPVTLDADPTAELEPILAALDRVRRPIIFVHPNADMGGRGMFERIRTWCAGRPQATAVVNLPPPVYLGLLAHAAALCGNTSSGLMEAPSFELPSVNIGTRQDGRERAASVIDCAGEAPAIAAALERALDSSFRDSLRGVVNPYGDGHASERIADVLASVELGPRLIRKCGDPATINSSPRS